MWQIVQAYETNVVGHFTYFDLQIKWACSVYVKLCEVCHHLLYVKSHEFGSETRGELLMTERGGRSVLKCAYLRVRRET